MITVTIDGNLVADAELRFTPNGKAVANFTVVSSERGKDGDQWVDKHTTFLRCQLWGKPAENAAESLTKGTRVLVAGKLRQRDYEKDGVTRSVFEVEVDDVAVSIKFHPVKQARAERSAAAGDPWAAPTLTDEPPF